MGKKMTHKAAIKQPKSFGGKIKEFIGILGPGLTTGAADDDPSGIATYSQTGAQFGYGQLWTTAYMLPLMIGVQEACARIGLVTGKGLAAVIKENYNVKVLYGVSGVLIIANVINIGADIGAMAAAARLIFPASFILWTLIFTILILLPTVFINYFIYSRILKWLALALLAYPFTAFMVHEPWGILLKSTFIPHIEWNFSFLFIITGVIGTTISPYMFFWQASQEVEEKKKVRRETGKKKRVNPANIIRLRTDNAAGMVFSEITTWSIMVVGGTVLHKAGIHNVQTAADAAKALEPLVRTFPHAGFLAKLIFSTGIIGLGLLAVPVLSGSAAYALSETFRWKSGLNLKWKRANGFYGIIIIATIIGLCINFVGINPVKALIYAAVLNGMVAVPLLFLIAKIARNKKIMGTHQSGTLSCIIVWFAFFAMAAAAVAVIFTSFGGQMKN